MDLFWKAAAGVLVTLILTLALGKQEKDFSTVLSLIVCTAVTGIAVFYLEPVLDFLEALNALGNLQKDMIGILMKLLGIGLVCRIAGTVCADAGNGALGKTVEILGGVTVLYLSLPIFSAFLELLQQILEEI